MTTHEGPSNALRRSAARLLILLPLGACQPSPERPATQPVGPAACPFQWQAAELPTPATKTGWSIDRFVVRPREITPAIRNGINDSAEFELHMTGTSRSAGGPNSAQFEIRDAQSCTVLRTVVTSFEGETASATWNGRDERGRIVPPSEVAITAVVDFGGGEVRETESLGLRISVDPCLDQSPQDISLTDAGDTRTRTRRYERFELPEPGIVCVRLSPVQSDAAEESQVSIDGFPLIDSAPLGEPVVASLQLPAGGHNLLIDGGLLGGGVDAWIPAFPDPPPEGTAFDAQTCTGRLQGFAHPFGLHDREVIERSGVVVDCVFVADVFHTCSSAGCQPSRRRKVVRARGRTRADGTFSVEIPESRFLENGVYKESAAPIEMRTECHPYECGYEAVGSVFSLQNLVDLDDGHADTVPGMDVNDVLDMVMFSNPGNEILDVSLVNDADIHSGLGVPSEPRESPRALVGARLVSNGTGDARNDLPLIVHEQIDTLNVEASRFMIWGMSGQVIKGELSTNACTSDFVRCTRFDASCNPDLCNSGDVHCLAAPLLQRLLDDGYDVWLVDHLQGRRDIVEIASAAPALYEAISRYPAPRQVAIGVPALDTRPPKRIAVSGISLGSVVARIALKLWEERDDLPDIDGANQAYLAIPTGSVEERVALYLSIDGPHRGARLPLALQAYLQDLPPIDRTTNMLRARINAMPTRQLLREWIPQVDAPCFDYDGTFIPDKDINNCNLDHGDLVDFATTSHYDSLFERTVIELDRPARDPFERMPDGLPDVVPSIAVSNGVYPPTPINVGTDEVLRLKLSAQLAPDPANQRIRDSGLRDGLGIPLRRNHQPGGSGFDGICVAQLESQSGHIEGLGALWGGGVGALRGGLVGGLVSGGAGILPGAVFGGITGAAIGEIIGLKGKLEVEIPMAPGSSAGGFGYPTLVPTRSSLIQPPGQQEPTATWVDYFAPKAPETSRRHTDFRDDQCRFVMYHLTGAMKGDRDGVPSCDLVQPTLSCAAGGMAPGDRLDPDGLAAFAPHAFCDCEDGLGHVSPFAVGINSCELRDRTRVSQ